MYNYISSNEAIIVINEPILLKAQVVREKNPIAYISPQHTPSHVRLANIVREPKTNNSNITDQNKYYKQSPQIQIGVVKLEHDTLYSDRIQ